MSDKVRQLDFPNYADVQEAMWDARRKWYNIGVRFKLNIHDLCTIEEDAGGVDDKFNKMLHAWFRNGENRTWEVICDTLQHNTVGMSHLAEKIRMKYIPPPEAEGLHTPKEKRYRADPLAASNQEINQEKEDEEEIQCRLPNGEEISPTQQEFSKDKVVLHSLSERKESELQASFIDSVASAPAAEQQSTIQLKPQSDESGSTTPEMIAKTKEAIDQLEKEFDTLVLHAQDDMISNKVDVRHLRHSITRLPGDLKDEHELFIEGKREEIREAKEIEDVFYSAEGYWDFLNYSLLQHLVDRHGSDKIKEEMQEHVQRIQVFRQKTLLCTFSKAYKRRPKPVDNKFKKMVTKHNIDWSTATLEDVEQFRNCICSEISLRMFCLQIAAVTLGSVVVTWLISESLVAYIEKAVKLNSQCLRIYHVSHLTIDGRIIYDGSAAMHSEHKVVRLEREVLQVNYSYLMDQMMPETVLTELMARRLLSPEKVNEVMDKSDWNQRLTTILDAVLTQRVVGTLPTLCAALCDTLGHEQCGKKLDAWYHSLLRGDVPPTSPTQSDHVMIPGDTSTPPASPPPGNLPITAQVEATALTRVQFNTMTSLVCSLLHLPTGDLVFDGYTLSPLTLYWHCSGVDEKRVPCFPLGIASNMINQRIRSVSLGARVHCFPGDNEMALLESAWDGDTKRMQDVLKLGANANAQMPDGWNSMMYAALLGHDNVVEMLLKHRASVHTTNKDGASALIVAACQGHTPVITRLLRAKADPDQKNKIGKTPLICAAQKGYVEVVDVLLKGHASVDIKKNDGTRALTVASCQGHAPVVKKLLTAGAHPDLENKAGTTPLMCAAQNGHEDVVSILLEHKAKVNIKRKDGKTALTVAVLSNHVPVARELLEANADPEQEIENGETFLMRAAKDNSSEMVENLLKYHADPNRQDMDGRTPLMWAAKNGNENMVKTLLHHGARVNIKAKDGRTALAEGFLGDHVPVVEKLLAAQADPEQENIEGESFITMAARYGRNEMAEKLLTYLADPNKKDEDGWTPLMWAAGRGDENLVKTLLHHGAHVNDKTISGWTALMFAAQEAHENVVEILIENGADIDIDNNCGFSALMVAIYHKSSAVLDVLFRHQPYVHTMAVGGFSALAYACWNEDLRSVRTLLTRGADPNVCSQDGKTPLLTSVRNGNSSIARELVDAKADPNYMDEEGGLSALMLSCFEGKHDMVKLLLEAKANPDLQELDTGWTALMFASRQGHVEIVKTLMLHNPTTSIRNMDGLTALDIASVGLQSDVCTVLQEHTLQDTTEQTQWMSESKDIDEVVQIFLKKLDHHPPYPDTDHTRVMRFD